MAYFWDGTDEQSYCLESQVFVNEFGMIVIKGENCPSYLAISPIEAKELAQKIKIILEKIKRTL